MTVSKSNEGTLAGGYERFRKTLVRVTTDIINEEGPERLQDGIGHRIFGMKKSATLDKPVSSRHKFVGEIFQGFIEIDASFRTLKDIEIYIGRFPYRNTSITKQNHLRYHIENFFSETYLLEERLLAYARKVERSYRQDRNHAFIADQTRALADFVREAFRSVRDVRKSHVHRTRLHHKSLFQVEFWEVLANNEPGIPEEEEDRAKFRSVYKMEYKKARREWKERIKTNNEQLGRLLDAYFDVIFDILFDKGSEDLNYPARKQR